MPTPQELENEFWDALKSDRTVMLGLDGGDFLPMTAMIDGDDHSVIWFFTAKDNRLAKAGDGREATINLAAKGHDVFACVKGVLSTSNDQEVIERLWNPFIAAWYEGKNDPKLALLRFVPRHAEIWENASSLLAGIKIMLGVDPKEDYADKVAEVSL